MSPSFDMRIVNRESVNRRVVAALWRLGTKPPVAIDVEFPDFLNWMDALVPHRAPRVRSGFEALPLGVQLQIGSHKELLQSAIFSFRPFHYF